MNNHWNKDEPPQDGTPIVAIGRIIASDGCSTWVEPFVMEVKWVTLSGHEGWHTRDDMSVARTLEDKVMIDWWSFHPKESNEVARAQIVWRIQSYLGNGGLFNPELMEHDKVRDLLIDCRDYLTKEMKETPEPERI